jgi:hypothetical protein
MTYNGHVLISPIDAGRTGDRLAALGRREDALAGEKSFRAPAEQPVQDHCEPIHQGT